MPLTLYRFISSLKILNVKTFPAIFVCSPTRPGARSWLRRRSRNDLFAGCERRSSPYIARGDAHPGTVVQRPVISGYVKQQVNGDRELVPRDREIKVIRPRRPTDDHTVLSVIKLARRFIGV